MSHLTTIGKVINVDDWARVRYLHQNEGLSGRQIAARPVVRTIEVRVPAEPQTAEEWALLLELFATRLTQGRIYRRDLPRLAPAIQHLARVWARSEN